MKKYFRIIFLVIIVFAGISYLTLNYFIKNYLPYSAIRPNRITKEQVLKNYEGLLTPASIGLSYSDFNITVEDSIKLIGWFINSQIKPSKGTIFLLHGIGSCKNAMLSTVNMFASEGFNCVCYDSRAQGESGGLNCTFGYYEKKDLSIYIDSVTIKFPNSAPYAVFGHSLGAAIAIQAMAEDKRIVCGISESPFANLRETIHDYFARITFFRISWISDEAMKYSEQIAHFNVDSVQPVLSAKKIFQPTMIIHGSDDINISPKYGKEIFNNLSSIEKIWYPILGANHDNLSYIGGSELNKKIINFFDKYLKE